MNSTHFQNQINRLIEVYGAKNFPKERVFLLWKKVSDLSELWMTRTVETFIEYEQYPPIGSKWDDSISKEREVIHSIQKEEHRQDAHDFFEGTYQNDDKRMLCQGIRDILLGKRTPEENAKFINLLQKTSECTEKKTVMSAVTRGE